jgi:hypothetical protein
MARSYSLIDPSFLWHHFSNEPPNRRRRTNDGDQYNVPRAQTTKCTESRGYPNCCSCRTRAMQDNAGADEAHACDNTLNNARDVSL